MPPLAVRSLLDLLEDAYQRRAWHGPNLKGSIRGVSAEEAAWAPSLRRHSAWEIAVHCAYWKYSVCRRILGAKRGSFPLPGSNWFGRPADITDAAWNRDREILDSMHRRLITAVASCAVADLSAIPPGSRSSLRTIISGAAMHDVYHAGQIQLLKRLRKERYSPARHSER